MSASKPQARGEGFRRARLICRREFRERVLQKAYRISLVIGTIVAVAAIVIPSLFGGDDDRVDPETVVVAIAPGAVSRDARLSALREAAEGVRGAPLRFRAVGSDEVAREAVRDGDESVGLLLSGDPDDPAATIVTREDGGGQLADRAAEAVDRAAALERIGGSSPGVLEPARVRAEVVQGSGPSAQSAAVVSVLGLLLYIAGILLTQTYATGIVSDRTNRVTERLLTAARPVEHLAGKLVGIGASGLLQFAVWIAAALIASAATGSGSALDGVPVALIAFFPVALVLTYVLYAAAATILVLPVRKTEDVGGAVTPVIMLQIVAFVATTSVVAPGSTVSGTIEALSLVPFFSPLLMLGRLSGGGVPAWEVAVAIVGPLLLAALFLRLAAPAYARYAIDAPGGKGFRAAIALLRR